MSLMDRLSTTQSQLQPGYWYDAILTDPLVSSASIPCITQSLKWQVLETSVDARNRIAAFLPSNPRSAGAYNVADEHEALYGLGRSTMIRPQKHWEEAVDLFLKVRMFLHAHWKLMKDATCVERTIEPQPGIQKKNLKRQLRIYVRIIHRLFSASITWHKSQAI